MVSSSDLKLPSPPPLAPFAQGAGTPGQAAFLNQQVATDKQVALNRALTGGTKLKGGATAINVETVPSPYRSVYGANFNEKLQLQNSGTSGQAQLNSKYDNYATVKGGKRRKRRSYKKTKTSKKRRSYRKKRTYKK